MSAASVMGTFNPYLFKKCSNLLHSQMMGMQKLWVRHSGIFGYLHLAPSHLVKLSLPYICLLVMQVVHFVIVELTNQSAKSVGAVFNQNPADW